MEHRTLLAGAGGLVIGVLIGMALTASGRSVLEAQLAERDDAAAAVARLEATVSSVEAEVAALGGRLGGVEKGLAELGTVRSGEVADLAARIDRVRADVAGAVSKVGSGVAGALSERVQGLLAREPAVPAGVRAPSGEGEAVRVGETARFGDARVFLSAFDEAAGTARVAVNGAATQVLRLKEPVAAGGCAVMLTGFAEGGARIAGACGPAQGSGAGTEIAVGATGALADGKLRVFLSGADADAGTARVAVNGTGTMVLRMSEPARAGDCEVTLTGIGEGTATIDAGC
jgi:hypothetical protein